jgi:tetratricopeptide (TPR) repeat protein
VTTSLPGLNIHSAVEISRGELSNSTNVNQSPPAQGTGPSDEIKTFPILADALKAFEANDLEAAIDLATQVMGDEAVDHKMRVRSLQLLGDSYLAGGDYEQAIGAFQVALELEETHEASKSGLAEAERRLAAR